MSRRRPGSAGLTGARCRPPTASSACARASCTTTPRTSSRNTSCLSATTRTHPRSGGSPSLKSSGSDDLVSPQVLAEVMGYISRAAPACRRSSCFVGSITGSHGDDVDWSARREQLRNSPSYCADRLPIVERPTGNRLALVPDLPRRPPGAPWAERRGPVPQASPPRRPSPAVTAAGLVLAIGADLGDFDLTERACDVLSVFDPATPGREES
jgi:hypothetical protein